MLRQIMVVIITPLGLAQIYNLGVRSVFIMTGINILCSNNNNNNRNKRYATHELGNGF